MLSLRNQAVKLTKDIEATFKMMDEVPKAVDIGWLMIQGDYPYPILYYYLLGAVAQKHASDGRARSLLSPETQVIDVYAAAAITRKPQSSRNRKRAEVRRKNGR